MTLTSKQHHPSQISHDISMTKGSDTCKLARLLYHHPICTVAKLQYGPVLIDKPFLAYSTVFGRKPWWFYKHDRYTHPFQTLHHVNYLIFAVRKTNKPGVFFHMLTAKSTYCTGFVLAELRCDFLIFFCMRTVSGNPNHLSAFPKFAQVARKPHRLQNVLYIAKAKFDDRTPSRLTSPFSHRASWEENALYGLDLKNPTACCQDLLILLVTRSAESRDSKTSVFVRPGF